MNKKLIAGLLGAGLILTAAPAFAGEWRADRGGCRTEIVRVDGGRGGYDYRGRYDRGGYDRVDYDRGRYDRGRADRGRTERITVCSRTSFRYHSGRGEYARGHGRGARGWREPEFRLSYDGRLHMYYRYDGGARIYIRG